jgi:hypothetical protein
MTKYISATCLAFACLVSSAANAAESLDQRIIGSWHGARTPDSKCQFLAWDSEFTADGRFKISFFLDKEKKTLVEIERGSWKSSNGENELKTDGVQKTEVYRYTVIDENTINYVNTVRDASADCQADYEFTEHRVTK